MRRAAPKFRPGSRWRMRVKMSPLRSLSGSHQPRPSWLMMTISPSPRRKYLKATWQECHLRRGRAAKLAAAAPAARRSSLRPSVIQSLHPDHSSHQNSGSGLAGQGELFSLFPICSRGTPSDARQPRSRRGRQGRAQHGERAARRTLAARQVQAVSLLSGLFCICAGDRHRRQVRWCSCRPAL